MSVVKMELLLATLLSLMVGTVGCATAQQINTTALDSSRVLSNADQEAMELTAASETNRVNIASMPTSLGTVNQIVSSTDVRVTQASFGQTVQPTLNTLAAAPLSILGQGDDLSSIVQHASGVVLLDFYADWCGPCRTQGGILHEMENTARQNEASIIKVNVDQHRRLAGSFNVTRLPTLILVKNGRIIERQTGVANHQRVADLLSR